ncbi:unnamed protein product [Cladocopium goreaui]|uniref:Uncharacterized protein n=1 Tax=Cladocopium goreaui TaxID=2562237 RepID=A0A9P1CBB5_9DINO|nr:unnamed protein product [Cladocopium goreaui]
MAANGQVFQDAQSQQETQVYDSDPMDVEKVNEEEVPLTQADGANDEPEEETQNHDSVVQVPASEAEEVCASEAEEKGPEASKQLVQPDPSRGFRPLPGAASVEGIGWKDLREMGQGADQYCSTCKAHVDPAPEKLVFKKGHHQWQCRTCHNVTTLLYKRMDMKNLQGWKDLSEAQVQRFYQEAGKCLALGQRSCFGKIQGCLIDCVTQSEVHRQETNVKGEFLPLSVWASKGYNTEAIEAKAEKRKSDMFGWVYRVNVLSINYSHIEEECRQRVLQATRKVGQSKPAGKAKGKGKNIADGAAAAGNGEQSGATPQALEDVMMIDSDWDSISSSGEQPARRGGGSKAKPSKSKAAKPKVKVTAEEKKEARTANNPHLGNARKALRLLEMPPSSSLLHRSLASRAKSWIPGPMRMRPARS